ncbi:hypothetical protein ACE193_13035 [Bernardetia sp. OM2101]
MQCVLEEEFEGLDVPFSFFKAYIQKVKFSSIIEKIVVFDYEKHL